ncbi:MAG: hypothetical protein R8K49_01940 [Mariprofundaceae bacterium]
MSDSMDVQKRSFMHPWVDWWVLSGGGSLIFLLALFVWQDSHFLLADQAFLMIKVAVEILNPGNLPVDESMNTLALSLVASVFFYFSFLVNYPHYTATYYRLVRNPAQWSAYKRPFTIATGIVLILYAATFIAPVVMGALIVTLFMLWSPYHYTGQNFGVGQVFLRNAGIRLSTWERRWVVGVFYAPWVFHLIWVNSWVYGSGYDLYAMKVINFLQLPDGVVMLAKGVALGGVIAFLGLIIYMRQVRQLRLPFGFITVVVVQYVWWWFLYLFVAASDGWVGAPVVAALMLLALPFFHCAQYLVVTLQFESRETPLLGGGLWHVLFYYVILIVGGAILFVLLYRMHHWVSGVSLLYAQGLFMGLINLHHFMVDGFIWKVRRPDVVGKLCDD